jgi:hypothetical protein
VLDVEGVFTEAGVPADPLLPAALESLASFVGAGSVSYPDEASLSVS